MIAGKKESRGVCHVLQKLANPCRRKDVSTLPLRLYASILWKEGMSQSIAKIIYGKNVLIDLGGQTNAGANELHLLH